jgi:class 3 adenylate cyclase
MRPETRYARSGDINIAYQISGEGEIDLVLAPGTTSHLDYMWEGPLRGWFEDIGAFCRLIRFDKRGTGLSDRPLSVATLEERMDDIRAVMDEAESENAVILGASEGASMACLYAATYPERTRALLVWGGMARWVQAPDYPWGMTPAEHRQMVEDCRENWPSRWYLTGPGAGIDLDDATPEQEDWIVRSMRAAASPAAAAALEEMNGQIDIRDILPSIRVPTLVLNRTGDPVAHVDAARDLASRIPDARFVEFPGDTHWIFGIEDEVTAVIREFVTGSRGPGSANRMLVTILAIDIVGSTELVRRLGDAGWSELLSRYYERVERELAVYRGTEIDRAGDGLLALFDGPTRAVRCALALRSSGREFGLELRAGAHTGEVEYTDGAVRGIAVHVAARVAALAKAGEVLVSSTVRDLAAGSRLEFDDAGLHNLKGVPEPRQLFSVR